MTDSSLVPDSLLTRLAEFADRTDARLDWPTTSLSALHEAGVSGWSIPKKHGGQERSHLELLVGSERLAGACLTTAFIWSQREAAVRRMVNAPNKALAARLLPSLARGECYMTVGLSQLTTSRRQSGPALMATPTAKGYRLNGEVPWVTGADRAAAVVIGAETPDGQQALFVLPEGQPGVFIRPPMELASLKGSRTSAIRLDDVEVESEWLLNGPTEQVLGGPGGGGLETSALALGVAAAAIADMKAMEQARPDLKPIITEFTTTLQAIRARLHETAAVPSFPDAVVKVRVESTQLALHATQAGLTAAKGTGFVAPHPAQRRARQALFFLVWSCPKPTAEGLLAGLAE